MSSCCEAAGAAKLFSRFAARYRRRYRARGLEKSQKQLIAGIAGAGFRDATLLEIGSGVGYLHQTLIRDGARCAIGVDLSADMLREAQAFADEQGLVDRVDYRVGDFVTLAPDLPTADVTVLDKVVCCYPDAQSLIQRSLDKTQRVYALTYPRDRRFNRIGVVLMRILLWLVRSSFRNYVHKPSAIEEWIAAAGFTKRYETQTFIWLTQVYTR